MLPMTCHDAIIVGGGPAGSTAAALLAQAGFRVLLLEEKRMPREKLCGEFITPESFPTLSRLGVFDELIRQGAQQIRKLSLITSQGQVDGEMADISRECDWAMSVSRARFDQTLFERARSLGAECREGIAVKQCTFDGEYPTGVDGIDLGTGRPVSFRSEIVIDASGRQSRLMLNRGERTAGRRGSRRYALKVHLENVADIDGRIELFLFEHGYGGLSLIENGLANLCFITTEEMVRRAGGDSMKVLEQTILTNPIARERLSKAVVSGNWLAAGPLSFGRRRLFRRNVIALGDAAGMIDPFTGTGMQIALRSAEIAVRAIIESAGSSRYIEEAARRYSSYYEEEFGRRMAIAGALRPVVFSPLATRIAAKTLAAAPFLARPLMRATRR